MRIVVIDDTILYRKLISDVITAIPGIDVVKRCRNGQVGLEAIRMLKPDLITLDLDMPELNGLELLDILKKEGIQVGVIIVSAHTKAGSIQTLAALDKGAFDFITKPDGESDIDLKGQLISKIRAWDETHREKQQVRLKKHITRTHKRHSLDYSPELIAIGISTGGPEALKHVIPQLAGNFPKPILIVQHMPPIFTKSLANNLNQQSNLEVKEAENGEEIRKGCVYIAPGGKQMKIAKLGHKLIIRITDDPPVSSCKPSVDYLFKSLSFVTPGRVLPIVMTGMGTDGTLGTKLLARHKCFTVVQDQESSVVFGMPGSIIKEGLSDLVLPLSEISPFLSGLFHE